MRLQPLSVPYPYSQVNRIGTCGQFLLRHQPAGPEGQQVQGTARRDCSSASQPQRAKISLSHNNGGCRLRSV